MLTVAEYLAEQLTNHHVTTVYGLPGGENVEILDAIRRCGIEFILVKNESSACFMADAHARLTGTIGVALTTLGPGATNAYVGLAHAYLDRSPILLITAQTDPYLIGTHTHQYIDLQSAYHPVTKFTAELTQENAASTIHHALHTAKSGRPGPVHLGINNRVALQTVDPTPVIESSTRTATTDEKTVDDIQNLLRDKNRPVIVVGLGLEPEKPYTELKTFVEKFNIPVIDTPKSKGALPASHPLFAGTIGLTRTDPAYEILDDSDCIIAIGFDVVEMVKPWDQKQPLIWIANWANQDPRIPCEVEYIGEIASILDTLADAINISGHETWGKSRMKRFHAIYNLSYRRRSRYDRSFYPQEVLVSIRKNTPDDVMITTDVGSHKIFTALNWQAQQPNTYFVSNGLSAMGFGLTSAIAAAKVTGKVTVCITGDAGLAMVMGEMALLKDYDLPLIIVVMNDSALDLIRSAQKRRGKDVFGTQFTNPDYEYIAKAYGIKYQQAKDRGAFSSAMKDAVKLKKPVLIDAFIDPIGYPTTIKNTDD